jgi:dephospho-CoA kinase
LSGYIKEFAEKQSKSILVIDADSVAKDIYCHNENVLRELKVCFNKEIFNENDTIKFNILARKVFSEKCELEKLNKLMFPLIEREIIRIIQKNKDKDFIIIDAAVLFESNLFKLCNYVILVESDARLRKEWLKDKKNNLSDSDIRLRIEGQHLKIYKKYIDFMVINNGTKTGLKTKVKDIFEIINRQELPENYKLR